MGNDCRILRDPGARTFGKFSYGGAFSARDDQSVQAFQMFGQPDFHGFHSESFQDCAVFLEISLKRQHSDLHRRFTTPGRLVERSAAVQ